MNEITYLGLALCEELTILHEVQVSADMVQKIKDPKIKRFVKLSNKTLRGDLTNSDKQEMKSLLKEPKVQVYLEGAKKVGQRIGWVYGGITGGVIGGLAATVTFATMGATGIGLAALGLLGALAGGVTTGYPTSKIKGILRKWKVEEEITQGGLKGGAILQL